VTLVPGLNDDAEHAEALAALIKNQLEDWTQS